MNDPRPAMISARPPERRSSVANDASVGDLDGDGQLDLVLKWDPSNAKDNSQAGKTDDVFLDGYTGREGKPVPLPEVVGDAS